MAEIVLVRHAAATGQEAAAPLSLNGYGQAQVLADFLRGFAIEHVVSSPFRRAVESIQPFAERSGLVIETSGPDFRIRMFS